MTRLKKVIKHFDALQHNLVIYYHKDLSLTDIYNRVRKNHPKITELGEPKEEDGCIVYLIDGERTTYLFVNQDVRLDQLHHESIHITTHAFLLTGSQHTEETDELYAYHSQMVFGHIVTTVIGKFNIPIKNLLSF